MYLRGHFEEKHIYKIPIGTDFDLLGKVGLLWSFYSIDFQINKRKLLVIDLQTNVFNSTKMYIHILPLKIIYWNFFRAGETPYNIDVSNQKTILSLLFGSRKLNTNLDTENMLGYDLYGSVLADILTGVILMVPGQTQEWQTSEWTNPGLSKILS